MALAWRIYYGDGSVFSSEDGPPQDAPCLDVQAIVQPHAEVGRVVVAGHRLTECEDALCKKDYYWFESGEWYAGDWTGLILNYLQHPGHKVVKFGKTISDERFNAIMRRATRDSDFTPRAPS